MTASNPAHGQFPMATLRMSGSAHGSGRRSRHNVPNGHGTRARWVKILEILAVLAIAIALTAAVALTSSRPEHKPQRTSRAFVEDGDTLWSLARTHPIPGQSTEQTARQIAELNELDSSALVAGSVVTLPQGGEQPPMLAQR